MNLAALLVFIGSHRHASVMKPLSVIGAACYAIKCRHSLFFAVGSAVNASGSLMQDMTAKLVIHRNGQSQTLVARRGLGFQAICARHETGIEFSCRASDCGICAIKVASGRDCLSPKTVAEADFLRAMSADDDERLACQARVMGNVEILVDYL